MFKKERGVRRATREGDETRRHILDAALTLFRERGFDETTMRDVAKAAGMSLGAAYYYFPSKEAIVTGYYESLITDCNERVRAAIAGTSDLRARLGAVLHTKIDLVEGDRALLGALFRFIGHPEHPLSALGPATRAPRELSMSTIEEALACVDLPPDIRALTVRAVWSLQMGILLFFLYDASPGQQRTRRLIDQSLDVACAAIELAKLPMSGALLSPVVKLLHDSNLL